MVVLMASWAPPKGNSCVSAALGQQGQSEHSFATWESPPQPERKLRGGGHKRRVEGHTRQERTVKGRGRWRRRIRMTMKS